MSNFKKIRSILTIRRMLGQGGKNAASYHRITTEVPSSNIVICVGTSHRRFVIPMTYLNHSIFQKLLLEAEEAYDFAYQGPITLPCDESVFEEILRFVSQTAGSRLVNFEDFQRSCNVDYRRKIGESRPLLYGGLVLSSTYK